MGRLKSDGEDLHEASRNHQTAMCCIIKLLTEILTWLKVYLKSRARKSTIGN